MSDKPTRSYAIDLLRGCVMIVMVLDHARDFFFGLRVQPTDLARTTPLLFATRWVTHFCAPVFVLLAGTAAYLYGRRHGVEQLPRYLLTRGLWLVLLELTLVRLAWVPDPFYRFTLIQVIWVIGWSMVALALICRLPWKGILALGLLVCFGHNLLDPIDALPLGWFEPVWNVLHERARLQPAPGHTVFISYPLLPWIGVISLGFALGRVFEREPAERRRLLLRLGLGATALFVVLRAANLYGDPHPWSAQAQGPAFTLMSFLNTEKYPPSLGFLLMTLGPALCLLAAFERLAARPLPALIQPLLVFGRVPLLFYVAHLYLLRYSSAPLAFMRFGASAFQPPPGHAGSPEYPLWAAYLAWLTALLLLYPLCRWFAALKARRTDAWLSYL